MSPAPTSFMKKYLYVLLLLFLAATILVFAGLHWSDIDLFQLLHRFGYPIIVLLTFLEGETVILLAASASEQLGLKLGLIALCAFCGSFASDQLMFTLGKHKGQALLRRFPALDGKMGKAKELFKKYDTLLILGFRFAYGMRNITPVMLGVSGVSHKKFFVFNFIGAAIWAAAFTYGGFYLGQAFMAALARFGKGFFAIITLLAIAALVIWRIRRGRKNV